MLDVLTKGFSTSLKKVGERRKRITERVLKDAVREIRKSLLEADADYLVVKEFTKKLMKKLLENPPKPSIDPLDSVAWTVYEELVEILGREREELREGVVMFVGLQGTGKTTTVGKVALYLKGKNKRVGLTTTDTRRPAAKEQLKTLAQRIGAPFYDFEGKPEEIAQRAKESFKKEGLDYLLLDTAGRLHLDEELMEELREIEERVKPSEVIYVADAMQGQIALETAKAFNERIKLTGAIITKMDSDAKGGVAFSLRASVGIPIKFIGVGEKLEDLEPFYPDRIAQRILGLGDIQTLAEKVSQVAEEDQIQETASKILSGEFDLEDFKRQVELILKLGPLEKVAKMIPGFSLAPKGINFEQGQRRLKKYLAIINSMTPEERKNPKIINKSRKIRIARGSGTKISDVNELLEAYKSTKKLMKKLKGMKLPRWPF